MVSEEKTESAGACFKREGKFIWALRECKVTGKKSPKKGSGSLQPFNKRKKGEGGNNARN